MAGNHLNEKMAEYNSVDHKREDPEKELSVDDLTEMNQPRSVQKLKSLDQNTKKKSSFVITGVVVAKQDRVLTEECDSYDDVDETCETHTEDVSSDILDLSKNTDIEPDPSSTEDVSPNLEEPPRDPRISDMTASRFKVVKIETQEPFKRGRWTCTDFLDPPAEKVEKSERGVDEAGSGNSSAASSIHYIPGVDDPAKNPLGSATMVIAEGYHPIVEPQPILPPTGSQNINVSNVNLMQNGDYTSGSMVMSGQSGAFQIHDNVNMPTQGDHTPSQQPQSLATSQPGLSSQAQPIPSQSKPSTLPAPHMSSQQHEYVHAPFSEPTPSSSQPSNGHIPTLPSQAQSTNAVTAQGSLLPGQSGVAAAPGTAQEAQKPSEYVPQGQDYNINATSQDYLPHGSQEYGNDYLPTGKDFLPPQPTDFGTAATPSAKEPAPKNESQPQLNMKQPSLSQSDYSGTSQSLTSASVPQSITPAVPPSSASIPKVGGQEYSSSGQTKPAPPLVVSNTSSGATVSPNNESVVVQGGDASLATTDRGSAFHISVRGEEGAPVQSSSSAVVEPAVSEAEEEANGAAAMSLEGKTAAAMAQSILTPPLLEMVSATINAGGMHQSKEEGDESGASTVAIDNKIEQAMDLVKSHLMFAVREEVEVLKEQIKELLEKNSQLECENSIYKAAATPETITKVKQQQQQQQQQQQPPSSSTS